MKNINAISFAVDPDNSQKVLPLKDPNLDNCYEFLLCDEDHTFAYAIQQHLLNHPEVKYVGYKKDHPSFEYVRIKIQTKSIDSGSESKAPDPRVIFLNACNELSQIFQNLESSFDKKTVNEMKY